MIRRNSSNRQSGKSSIGGTNGRSHTSGTVEMPPVESVVARLETLTKLLHESNQTRLAHVFMEIQVLADDLRKVGPYLEQAYPDALDRVMASMRDASASAALPPSLRLAVFELVELRASKWSLPSDTCNYYRQRRIVKEGPDLEGLDFGFHARQDYEMQPQTGDLPQGSGAAPKAFRQEILIKNSDSGKVMGVRGRRISKIEKLSDTIVSFEKVDPLAKERVLSINGYTQQSINLAKQLIQETIARNSSPVFDGSPTSNTITGRQPSLLPTPDIINGQSGIERQSSSSALDQVLIGLDNFLNNNNCSSAVTTGAADVPLFNYTVTVGSQTLRVSGNNLGLVQEAKLALDDHFAQKYPQMFYTMHVRTRTTSSGSNCNDGDEIDEDDEVELDSNRDLNYDEELARIEAKISKFSCRRRSTPGPSSSGGGGRTYNRTELLSLGERSGLKPPDFSHLDQNTKDNIVLQKPRSIEVPKLGISSASH